MPIMGFPFAQYIAAHLSTIPVVLPNKRPAVERWANYQKVFPTLQVVNQWHQNAGAIIAGAVSGNVVCFDFDLKNDGTNQLFDSFMEELSRLFPHLAANACIQKTMNKGRHLIFRAETSIGNKKLAQNKEGNALIETRGEGGYFVVSPSPGYEFLQGDITQLYTLTKLELDALQDLCSTYNEFNQKVLPLPKKQPSFAAESNLRAGDIYDESMSAHDVAQLLVKHGWTIARERADGTIEMSRPGKSARDGISATIGHNDSGNRLYVFTSSVPEFEPNRSYRPYQILAAYEYGGDFHAMAKALSVTQKKPVTSVYTLHDVNPKKAQEVTEQVKELAKGAMNKSKSLALTKTFIESNYTLRYNTLRQRTEIKRNDQWQELADRDVDTILVTLHDLGIAIAKEKVNSLLNSEWVADYDPLLEWSYTLEKWSEDEHPDYITELARTVKVKPEQELFWYTWFKNWLVASVATWFKRSVNHTCLVLQGPQGIGKTQWLNKLCPVDLFPYLYVGSIEADNKDALTTICENVLINLDELESTTKKDISHLKSLITREYVDVRRAYAHYAKRYKRLASFCGSVNLDQIFNDPTGNRRFIIVSVEEIDYKHSVNMVLVFSQALALLEQGYKFWGDKEGNQQLTENAAKYAIVDPVEEILSEYITKPNPELYHQGVWLTATQIVNEIAMLDKVRIPIEREAKRVGILLTKGGYEKRLKDGCSKYCIKRINRDNMTATRNDDLF